MSIKGKRSRRTKTNEKKTDRPNLTGPPARFLKEEGKEKESNARTREK